MGKHVPPLVGGKRSSLALVRDVVSWDQARVRYFSFDPLVMEPLYLEFLFALGHSNIITCLRAVFGKRMLSDSKIKKKKKSILVSYG